MAERDDLVRVSTLVDRIRSRTGLSNREARRRIREAFESHGGLDRYIMHPRWGREGDYETAYDSETAALLRDFIVEQWEDNQAQGGGTIGMSRSSTTVAQSGTGSS